MCGGWDGVENLERVSNPWATKCTSCFYVLSRKDCICTLCLLCTDYSCRRRSRSLEGPLLWETRDKSKWIWLSLTPAEGFTGCPERYIRIILGKKKTPGISNLSWSLFPFQLILMLVQSYLNANFFPLWVWNGQKPPNGLREIKWKILLLKTREWALPWSDSGELNFTDMCVHAYVSTGLLHESDGNQKGSLSFHCFTFAVTARQNILISAH